MLELQFLKDQLAKIGSFKEHICREGSDNKILHPMAISH